MIKFLAGAAVALMLFAAVVATAQTTQALRADVPFDFSIGDKVLPAGRYEIKPYVGHNLMLHNIAAKSNLIVSTNFRRTNRPHEQAVLIFNKYGDQYFLGQVWAQDAYAGNEVIKSRHERELIARGTVGNVTVVAAKD